MFIALLLSAQAPAPLSLAAVRKMPPEAAGDVLLRDQQHGLIESFEAPTGGMTPPGMVEGQLVERPAPSGSGCIRARWTVQFRALPGSDIRTAIATSMNKTVEIAPRSGSGCPTGRYVHLNPGLSVDQGWQALAQLDTIAQSRRTRFRCADRTSSDLCRSGDTIRANLNALKPWAITREAGEIAIWLGTPGGLVTEVRFAPAQVSRAAVIRRVPAPF